MAADIEDLTTKKKGHHRRTSSLWVPPSRPALSNPAPAIRQTAQSTRQAVKTFLNCPCLSCCPISLANRNSPISHEYRTVIPNHKFARGTPRYEHPNRKYSDNRIRTTKYSLLTFLPKNLFEQFHRFANLYFIFIVMLNWVPSIETFSKYISMLPITSVLMVTAVKDAFEDWRRYRSDQKINHSTCRVWDNEQERYRKLEWQHVLVGDFVHLSCNEIIPADILLLRSSHPLGTCYVETSNLDGENNLKQRQVLNNAARHSLTDSTFQPTDFTATIEVEAPNNHVYRCNGFLLTEDGSREPISKNNLLLRGCEMRNTDFVEGIVLYAGKDTKAMLNNSGPRYKRSELERLINLDIVWCVVILLLLCTTGAVLSALWFHSFDDPYSVLYLTFVQGTSDLTPEFEGFINFWSYIIVLQIMIPISLYISIEIVKLGQLYLMSQDASFYYEPTDRRIQCRALNIPEELGQIQYVMCDKTGTLTENQMIFRRCVVDGIDYGPPTRMTNKSKKVKETVDGVEISPELACRVDSLLDDDNQPNGDIYHFFINMALCNTVVVNVQPHVDRLDQSGYFVGDSFISGNAAFHMDTEEHSCRSRLPSLKVVKMDRHQSLTPLNKSESRTNDSDTPPQVHASEKKTNDNEKDEPQLTTSLSTFIPRPSMLNLNVNLSKWNRSLQKGLSPLLRFKKGADRADSPLSPSNPIYEAESPDELALVYASWAYGIRLLSRQASQVLVELPTNRRQRFELLHILPFDSERKRMSVIVKPPFGDRIFLYCKGADSSIMSHLSPRFSDTQRGQMLVVRAQHYLSTYAGYGLRTLCLGMRKLDQLEYQSWKALHEEAEIDIDNRDKFVHESALRIETNLELLGVTGVEDRLQDGVPECIEMLRRAGLNVWVLTGDKIETAVNIAYASRLFSPGLQLIQLSAKNEQDTCELLDYYMNQFDWIAIGGREGSFASEEGSLPSGPGLVISGQTLTFCLLPSNESKFVHIVSKCSSVLCCRTTPLQKASVVKLAKEKLHGKVLAIGDGANDVSMIQCADVGVGLSGQEGMQLFVFAEFWYQLFNGFSSQVPIDPIYLMLYNLLFTSIPALIYGITEQDASDSLLLGMPSLYSVGRLGKVSFIYEEDPLDNCFIEALSMLFVLDQYAGRSVAEHCHLLCCSYGELEIYANTDCDLWTFGFLLCAQLLIVNSLHLAIEVRLWTLHLFASLIGSFLVFIVFALLYNLFVTPEWNTKNSPNMVAEYALIDVNFWAALVLTAVLALLPRFTIRILLNIHRPLDVLFERMRLKTMKKSDSVMLRSLRYRWSKHEKTVNILRQNSSINGQSRQNMDEQTTTFAV